jgi:acyl-CoA thioesterase-1
MRVITLMLLTGSLLSAQSKWKLTDNLKATNGYIRVPVFAEVEEEPGLPRVLIIGDSISMYYTLKVRHQLKGKANVYRIPDNGRSTKVALENIDYWLGDGTWSVIHFNWGLHDIVDLPDGKRNVPIDTYENNLRALVKKLQGTGAKLMWGSTTPVPEGAQSRHEEDVLAYNARALQIMNENHIPVDDLHQFVTEYAKLPATKDKLQYPSNVHFRPEASADLGIEVAKKIEAMLAK